MGMQVGVNRFRGWRQRGRERERVEAIKGWEALCQQAPANTATAWRELRTRPDHLGTTNSKVAWRRQRMAVSRWTNGSTK
jgi:hypothetical protein